MLMQKTAAVLLSGILLFCSFPPLEWSFCAWVALVPLICQIRRSDPGEAFRSGLIAGLVFWLASICWLTHVSWIGWLAVSLYCALYLAVFALIVSWWSGTFRRVGPDCQSGRLDGKSALGRAVPPCHRKKLPRFVSSDLIFLFGFPAIWVGLEYARAHLLTGFPWNLLGVSQYAWCNLIQCADWGGAYLVSYLVVMGNTAVVSVLVSKHGVLPEVGTDSLVRPSDRKICGGTGCPALPMNSCRHGFWPAFTLLRHSSLWLATGRNGVLGFRLRRGYAGQVAGFRKDAPRLAAGCFTAPAIFLPVLGLVICYGHFRLMRCPDGPETIQLAALQLNVPQQYKWSEEWAGDIYRRLSESTAAAARSNPDLIVWPETALPDCIRHDESSRKLVKECLRQDIPLLAGSMDYRLAPEGTNFYNSAFLYLPDKPCPQVYNKRHLVAFGEFIPFARYFPFLRLITGIEEDFTPGREVVVFAMPAPCRAFSVLICFEDTLPYLARDCVRAGARMLVNQTNDAWFDPSWASRQHMIQSVFRCVENRVGCLRVTNTGVTCLIDRRGMIRAALAPLGRFPRAPEVLCVPAAFAPEKMPLTFYTRRGDIFAIGCAAFSIPLCLGALLGLRRKKIIQGVGNG